jgi:membrane-bound lytic murein transglycosylase D
MKSKGICRLPVYSSLLTLALFFNLVVSNAYAKGKPAEISSTEGQEGSVLKLSFHRNHFNTWLNYFSKRNTDLFDRYRQRGRRYEKIVRTIFRQHGLPEDLFYVGMIESGYLDTARSHAEAVGPWQFIASTGKAYGLRIDHQVDERLNIVKSTQAAARYLRDLYNIFGSWELALCAYNKGEYGIIRSIRKGNTRNYLELVRKRLLPDETVNYVPKIAAARELYRNPQSYGMQQLFDSSMEIPILAKFKKKIDLLRLSKEMNITYSELRQINPDIKGQVVTTKGSFSLVIPREKKELLQKYGQSADRLTTYIVQKGDTLHAIARRFGIEVAELLQINKIKADQLRPNQEIRVPI